MSLFTPSLTIPQYALSCRSPGGRGYTWIQWARREVFLAKGTRESLSPRKISPMVVEFCERSKFAMFIIIIKFWERKSWWGYLCPPVLGTPTMMGLVYRVAVFVHVGLCFKTVVKMSRLISATWMFIVVVKPSFTVSKHTGAIFSKRLREVSYLRIQDEWGVTWMPDAKREIIR